MKPEIPNPDILDAAAKVGYVPLWRSLAADLIGEKALLALDGVGLSIIPRSVTRSRNEKIRLLSKEVLRLSALLSSRESFPGLYPLKNPNQNSRFLFHKRPRQPDRAKQKRRLVRYLCAAPKSRLHAG